jgi:UDP-glucose:(heptosyl)LPS alpha-1,3-glucosyltransferase
MFPQTRLWETEFANGWRELEKNLKTDGIPLMLNIAICIKRFGRWGGKETYAVEVARRLVQKGHQISVFATTADPDLLRGMTFHRVTGHRFFSSVLTTLNFIHETRRIAAEGGFDIVHSHERHYHADVQTLHSFSYLSGMDQYSGLRKFDQKYLSPRSLAYLWLEKRQMGTPWLIAVSGKVAEDIGIHYHRTDKIRVIRPGVDIEAFHPRRVKESRRTARERLGIGDNELAILFVGSAFKRKGLDRLIRAISKGMRLLVVGTGDHLSLYKKMVTRHGLSAQVSFSGFIKDVKPYYAAADIVALPSRSEAFGMSILEAMACGLPTIVSANAGVAEIVDDQANGCLMRDPDTLPDLLKALWDANVRARMGEMARETAQSHSWEKVAAAHEDCYRMIVSGKAA